MELTPPPPSVVPTATVTTRPVAAGPVAAGPVAAGPVAAGPVAAGPVAAGPVAAAGARPRLVATDLDGTLLGPDRAVSPYTARTLARLTASDVPVVLVTGRPIRWLKVVYDQLDAPLPAICANGAVVYDPVADEVLRADPLAPELLAEVARRLRAAVPGVSLAVEVVDSREMRHEAHFPLRWEADPALIRAVTTPEDLLGVPAVKLLVRAGEQDPDLFTEVVAEVVAGLAEATHSSRSGLVELSASGVTKAAGLAWYCARLGIAAPEVLAFGDMPNDVPMLTWAGRAVAVGNAHPAVRAIADEVTSAHTEDGVAAYLDRLYGLDRP
ncbi:HAD family hydrolase [Micromonospora sp. WMMD882]|uniref:HAD family hydrolase n=1 Tax=Micromonospora sp. WMMD882 TaxID=3015151 RepID=UPI00248CFD2A|nr:HAD family hydrolase [Micromonospora sp. WMMD882]WBB78382.1 HAD family hydrolase [Micromonospora sp. WMMD882]